MISDLPQTSPGTRFAWMSENGWVSGAKKFSRLKYGLTMMSGSISRTVV